jgi:hypothetical protein
MRRLAAVLALILAGYPLLVAASSAVLALGAGAVGLCWLGIVTATPVLAAGMVLALSEYALALWLAGGPPRLAGAVLVGVVLILLLETAEFGRRAHRAEVGPGVLLTQIRSWAVLGALTGAGALVLSAAASVASAAVRLPWAPAIAGAGAAIALVAIALAVRGTHQR